MCVFLFLVALGSEASTSWEFVFGMFLMGTVSYIRGILDFKKNWNHSMKRISESTYEYKVFEDYIRIGIYRNNEKFYDSKRYLKDIEQIQQLDKWVFLQVAGQMFILFVHTYPNCIDSFWGYTKV